MKQVSIRLAYPEAQKDFQMWSAMQIFSDGDRDSELQYYEWQDTRAFQMPLSTSGWGNHEWCTLKHYDNTDKE